MLRIHIMVNEFHFRIIQVSFAPGYIIRGNYEYYIISKFISENIQKNFQMNNKGVIYTRGAHFKKFFVRLSWPIDILYNF